ncbi:syntenin-2 isoform X4 [Mirounga angustirostris]|uniref:syntenin-2 isoform X4 n=1 Tax=Mirounga angustirostris TaxID=9716 RepID=UPI00313DB545
MSTLYPSLEDLKLDQAIQAQARAAPRMPALPVSQSSVLYPSLAELENYMGLSLSSQEVQQSLLQIPEGASGLFVQLVKANSPASLVGLHFGDQILQIDGRDCAGWSTDRAHRVLKRASAEKIVMVARDRPFQRTITMHKDSMGHIGFVIKKGKVISVVQGSAAAHNGLLTNHTVCEVNGQNVIGLKRAVVLQCAAESLFLPEGSGHRDELVRYPGKPWCFEPLRTGALPFLNGPT